MNRFIFCTSCFGGADRKTIYTAGVIYETPRGMYEAYVTSQNEDRFMFNMRPVSCLPLNVPHIRDTVKLLLFFGEHREQFLRYARTQDRKLWWKLKNQISPN